MLQFILLAAFMAAGLSLMPFVHADAWNAVVTGLIGVAAMAIRMPPPVSSCDLVRRRS